MLVNFNLVNLPATDISASKKKSAGKQGGFFVSKIQSNGFELFDMQKSMFNKVSHMLLTDFQCNGLGSVLKNNKISFKGYYGDPQPLKKLFWISTGRNDVYEDNWTKEHIYQVGTKKWVNARPNELLRRTPEQVIQCLCTLTKPDCQYPGIPPYIPSPNFGDKWGRFANYIEINPRIVATYANDNNRLTGGLLGAMKLLPAIPTSPNSFANCVVLSQLYPAFYGDGYEDADSLYCANLHTGISQTLSDDGLNRKMGADEQVKAFNDMAHLLGFKTGFRMPLSSRQLKVQNRDFNWYEHEKAFIDACVWGIELGFDAIYFDSGKHIIDKNGYCGQGDVPNKGQMAYILYKIREQTGRSDIAFIGEKCNDNWEYKDMGFTAGTDWGKADNYYSVRWEADKQKFSREYAAGPEVSNDNDEASSKYEAAARLNRINSCLFGYHYKEDKIPSYMQLTDIFPLSPYTNTHEQMLHAKKMEAYDAWTKCERHWDGVFDSDSAADYYRNNVYHIFENVIRTFG